MAGPSVQTGPSRRRLTIFYVVLVAVAAAVAAVAISLGQDVDPVKPIAGGYDVAQGKECLTDRVDIKQSGRFASLDNVRETVSGKLEDDDGRLTGDIDCANGQTQKIDARAVDGRIDGALGAGRVTAELKRDPPQAGTPRARVPGAIAGDYKLTPRSDCIGQTFELAG